MIRALTILALCSFAIVLPADWAQAAPVSKAAPAKGAVKKGTPKKTTPVGTKGAKPKAGPAKAQKVKATGPNVGTRHGLNYIGAAPAGTPVDGPLAPVFGPMEIKSESSGGAAKAQAVTPVVFSKMKYTLTASKPVDGAASFRAYKATWNSAQVLYLEPEIQLANEGGLSILVPNAGISGEDLKIECKGAFASSMKVQAGVQYSQGFYTTHSAEFSYVEDTLKFLVTAPESSPEGAYFSIGMHAAKAADTFSITSCSAQRV